MTDGTVGAVKSILEAALAEVEDPETRYKLRTALQLLVALDADSKSRGAVVSRSHEATSWSEQPEVRDLQ